MSHISSKSKSNCSYTDQQGRCIVGVDLSKDALDVFFHSKYYHLRNDESGFRQLLHLIKPAGEKVILAYESTGCLSRPFTRKLIAAGIHWICLQPYMVRNFARGVGQYAKTDKIDAEMIARYVCVVRPQMKQSQNNRHLDMQDIYGAIELLKRSVASIRAACKSGYVLPSVLQNLSVAIEELTQRIKSLQDELLKIIMQDNELKRRYELYLQEPGIGTEIALCLVCYLPELGLHPGKRISALVGVAPYNWQSGNMNATRHIYGGRKRVRDMLYMSAIAIRRCKQCHVKEFYLRQKSAGKSSRELAINCAHKILRILNAKTRAMLESLSSSQISSSPCLS